MDPANSKRNDLRFATVKISSQQTNLFPTQPPFASALPEKVDLNFGHQLHSFGSSSLSPTATIPAQDFPVFTTDSNQSTWLPSTSTSLPAQSAQQQKLKHLDLPPNQQDFVLFDQPIKPLTQLPQHQHRSQQQFYPPGSVSPSLQGTRVANIIQATGHPHSPAFTNRLSSPAQNPQFYASSAPSSTVALNQQNRLARPPVPLFAQSTGSIPQGKMNLQGNPYLLPLEISAQRSHMRPTDFSDLEDFTAFEGGASTTAYSSPAIASVFDINGSAPGSTNMGTVSPQDLLIQEPFMSAPNSTALTSLTSPSIYGDTSPDFGDGYDVSPSFGSGDFDVPSSDVWYPLFPQENGHAPQALKPEQSPAEQSDELEVVETTASSGHRRKSSTNSPPSGRHSSVSGVNSRRRDKPLPPIIVEDPSDVVAMKRARNTLAARKSRERKALRFDELEDKIAKLEAERDHWKKIALGGGGQ
ncbi:hypothetical protein GQ53DRAFT_783680 [Thozetella sp. PMI_491]|nr:hypothetical protein GQ53DRAFT_783680 [Thozetella sp. PMI_491]